MSTVVVDPVTRIEGHLRIEAETENGIISRAASSGTMLRGIENVLIGRDPRDAWAIAQRICGVCTLVHGIASVRAVENALAYPIPPNAELIRNLMIGAQFVHDHVMHFYHLHALDWVDVVSALDADPKATSDLQKCLSPWHNSSRSYFADVKERLSGFVGSGQLGIFANGYWGHPEYKLPPELNLLAFAHYLEALDWQRKASRLHALFGGKNPHPNFIVGGAPCALDGKSGATALDAQGRALVVDVIADMRRFVDEVYVPDTLAIARYYKDWARRGEGVGNFMTYGEFPDPFFGADDTSRLFVPRGVILNRDLSNIHPVDLDDETQVQEYVSHSWYNYSGGQDQPLHPYAGETRPNYTGPQPPYDNLAMDQAYSWLKSPRWKGKPMEVGPLARVLMLYASGHAETKALVDGTLSQLKLPQGALFSTLGRIAARTLETKLLADKMSVWCDQLLSNLQAGDSRTHNDDFFYPDTWPTSAQGAGYTEAPRGALAHWVVIEDGRIANYQAVVPSTWNAGPRDAQGQEGPYEAALRGHRIHDAQQPLEILRTIHSFDPCLACAVHLVDPDGESLVRVTVT
ncbi:nickel-dependent hydrogenase large subunit [Thiorhodococcus mannitoliphagus]|uniref:Uptake hydrogenase large subunit n=1 Tax=Thiorhodococcus mannitoliphagus TaxID=329406 RepID=A0A6P1DZN0_9GAMM|nr:nickel-dependent hydrogenase large subunit [Thiorhodococcus mannitoliphagus]NEX20985.1 nickel-dependent hydrogenase large subunit [Thiorhodococcus mannitoliphagus]